MSRFRIAFRPPRKGASFISLGSATKVFTRVCDEMRIDVAIGVGGSLVDAEFLARRDVAIIIPGAEGEADAELVAQLRDARIAPAPGPAGGAAAVDEAWRAVAAPKRKMRRSS